jgi:acetylornithine deacetylase/succinyl-diaminopimelate desuccinylase-like protein
MPATSDAGPAAGYVADHRRRMVAELRQFVRFPSVGAQPKHNADVARCADWLANHLRAMRLQNVRVVSTERHPIVRADWLRTPGKPTVLIYGHYDVQPVDPVGEWTVPPFGGDVRGDHLFGRGASDDKGQMFAHVKAIEALLQTRRRLPVNVKCLFEGEEESGSTSLPTFLRRHRDELAADVAVMSDSPMATPDRPAITYAMRGSLSLTLTVRGPNRDLHSGLFGGAVHNPLQALSEIVSSMHRNGRVAIEGFYDDVRALPADERAFMARHGPTDDGICDQAGVERGWGESGYTLYERTTIRPALTVNGLNGGYQGTGGKAVIPAVANAKVSFRLVPDQDPATIERLLHRHLRTVTPPTVRASVKTEFMALPTVIDRRHPVFRAAAFACRRGFGKSAAFLRCGGTIPVVSMLKRQFGVPVVMLGFGRPDARIHAPDERLHLPTFFKSVATCIHFLTAAGRVNPERVRRAKEPSQ